MFNVTIILFLFIVFSKKHSTNEAIFVLFYTICKDTIFFFIVDLVICWFVDLFFYYKIHRKRS